MSGKHLVIACGGTGGHFYPTLAIAEAWRDCGNDVTLAVAGQHSEEQLRIAESRGISAVSFPAVRLPSGGGALIRFPFAFLSGWKQARRAWKSLSPDVVLGMGSYASVLTCLTRPKGISLFLHEGNAFMGKANRLFAKKSIGIGLSLPLWNTEQAHGKPCKVVGMPLREQLVDAALHGKPDADFLPSLGLENGVPTVLVFGGSQGARALNEAFVQAADALQTLRDRIQFIHLTGPTDGGQLAECYAQRGIRASIRISDPHIERCYLSSDLVFCRAGASSLCELALFGKPAVLIPLPSSADDHQVFNTKTVQGFGGAIHIPQEKLDAATLLSTLTDFLEKPEEFRVMGKHLQENLAHPDAAQQMVRFMLERCENAGGMP